MYAAGPQMDIVVPALRAGEHFTPAEESAAQGASTGDGGGGGVVAVGCLAHDVQSYAECIMAVLDMAEGDRLVMAQAGRQRALMFSQERFQDGWMAAVAPVLPA